MICIRSSPLISLHKPLEIVAEFFPAARGFSTSFARMPSTTCFGRAFHERGVAAAIQAMFCCFTKPSKSLFKRTRSPPRLRRPQRDPDRE